MGKPKKGKKSRQDEQFSDEDIDLDPLAQGQQETDEAPKPAGKKGKKGRRKKDDDWDEDDISAEIEALSLEAQAGDVTNGQAEEVAAPVSKKQKKKDKKKKQQEEDDSADDVDDDDDDDDDMLALAGMPSKAATKKPQMMSAFQMLDIEDASDDQGEMSSSSEEVKPVQKQKNKAKKKEKVPEEEPEDTEITEPAATKGKKAKKGKQKKQEQVEDDIDAILAQIESAPSEKSGKKGKKNKEKMDVKAQEEPVTPVVEDSGLDFQDLSSMTQDEVAEAMGVDDDEDDRKKQKQKKAEAEEEGEEGKDEEDGEDEEAGGTVKTAAQKKKEKREKQRLKKLQEKKQKKDKGAAGEQDKEDQVKADETSVDKAAAAGEEPTAEDGEPEEEGEAKKKKKDKKKKKGEKPEKEEKKPSKMVRAMQEALRIQQEEQARLEREEEERIQRIEEALKAKEEKEREEAEKREKAKQKKKERQERAKAEGRYKTPKQKEAERRARQMLEAMKAQGLEVPQASEKADGEKKKRVTYQKKKRPQMQQQESTEDVPKSPEDEEAPEVKATEEVAMETSEQTDDIKDDWAAESDEEVKDAWDAESDSEKAESKPSQAKIAKPAETKKEKDDDEDEDSDDEEEEDEDEDESDESEEETESSSEESDDGLTAQERAREKAMARIQKRKDEAKEKVTTDKLRAAVVCVLGHVDTGKTKILDKLRRTNVQDGEAGGITQQIGATNVPRDTIKEQTRMCKEFAKEELKLPGLLIIDTPGHESFSNLRTRGSSLCDIAILVVDIMHGLEPQTIESINLLKQRKCPFVVALNKIDRLFQWQSNPHNDVVNTIKKQKPNTRQEFQERVDVTLVQFAEQGLNTALFYENKNPKEFISLVPTSAISGDGMGNLMALVCQLSQTFLASKVAYREDLQATVMEVKEITGLGTTIDVILVNGSIREGETAIVPGTEGPIVTQIRGLLMPKPLRELRVKGSYDHVKEVVAAQGVKIIAKDLEKAMAGLPLYVAKYPDEIDIYKEEVSAALADALSSIKLQDKGVFVQASTLGSLEALIVFLKDSKIPYAGINIGPVHKKDIMRTSAMLERDSQYAVILAFDIKVEREAQELADSLGVRIFTADIIYHLFDKFMAYRDELKKQKQEEFKHVAVFPCKLRIIPQYIFNSRDPIVVGVSVEAGFLKHGTRLCVPSKEFLEVGRVTSIEINHKTVDRALKGQEVCIKIEPIPGEAPKMYGRHFDETDLLISKISRPSIDAVKSYFRDDMSKTDWQLMVELKKTFEII